MVSDVAMIMFVRFLDETHFEIQAINKLIVLWLYDLVLTTRLEVFKVWLRPDKSVFTSMKCLYLVNRYLFLIYLLINLSTGYLLTLAYRCRSILIAEGVISLC